MLKNIPTLCLDHFLADFLQTVWELIFRRSIWVLHMGKFCQITTELWPDSTDLWSLMFIENIWQDMNHTMYASRTLMCKCRSLSGSKPVQGWNIYQEVSGHCFGSRHLSTKC